MHIEHSIPPAQAPEVRLNWEISAALPRGDASRARRLLSELRHVLENGCNLATALDVLDEAEAALQALPGSPASANAAEVERLNLVQLLSQSLKNAADMIARSNVVVLKRKALRRMVSARKRELSALLDEVVQVAVRCCASAVGARILRFRIHNDQRGYPRLIVEHSADCAASCEPVMRHADGVEVAQDHARCTIKLTFLNGF